jgi:hypothetical protein
MVAVMSAPDRDDEHRQQYATIIVVGGGCYGSYYVRQLRRAVAAGALTADRIVVVDRDVQCAVARDFALEAERPHVEIRVAEWSDFFDGYLSDAVARPDRFARDAIVPSPLMPHLMGAWIIAQAHRRFGDRVVSDRPFEHVPQTPWSRAGGGGVHYASYATWTCPINCVEPRTCPHTRGARDWSLPVTIARHERDETASGRPTVAVSLFCRHRAYGVGMFDTTEVVDAHRRIMDAAGARGVDAIIGTVSHCHGALARLTIRAPGDSPDSPVP